MVAPKLAISLFFYHTFGSSILLMTARPSVSGQCIYSTMTGYIYPYGPINNAHIIEDFNGDCESLCFKSTACLGANVRRLNNGSIVCEFRLIPPEDYAFSLAVPEKDSKFIAKLNSGVVYENVALTSGGATCTAESTYSRYLCTRALDGRTRTSWISNRKLASDRTWIQVNLRTEMLIYRVDLYYTKFIQTRTSAVTLEFSDGSQQAITDLSCNPNATISDAVEIVPVITTYVKVTLTALCHTTSAVNLRLDEVAVYGFAAISEN